jgi:hypothetical protein
MTRIRFILLVTAAIVLTSAIAKGAECSNSRAVLKVSETNDKVTIRLEGDLDGDTSLLAVTFDKADCFSKGDLQECLNKKNIPMSITIEDSTGTEKVVSNVHPSFSFFERQDRHVTYDREVFVAKLSAIGWKPTGSIFRVAGEAPFGKNQCKL